MIQKEYLKTIVFNNHMVNIGIDYLGQDFIIEYLDDNNILVEESCGTYTHYLDYLENKWGGCQNCNDLLTLVHGEDIVGYACRKTGENIPKWMLIPPCKEKKENNNE